MPTVFPTTVDSFSNPLPIDGLGNPPHATQHADANDAIEAIESYVFGLNTAINNLTTASSIYINVKDPTYGAVGDGVADDAAAIQSAVTAAAVSDGVVFFPPGLYLVSSPIVVPTNVWLFGTGYTENAGGSYAGDFSVIRSSGAMAQTVLFSGNNSGMRLLQVDGAGLATAAVELATTGFHTVIQDCGIKRGATNALLVAANRCVFAGNHISQNQTTPAGTTVELGGTDHLFANNTVGAGLVSNLNVTGGTNRIVGNHITGNNSMTGANVVLAASRQRFVGNTVDSGGAVALLHLTASGSVVSGNLIFDLSLTDNTIPAIRDESVGVNTYTGNRIEGQGNSNRFSYAIETVGTESPIFVGNACLRCVELWNNRPKSAVANQIASTAMNASGSTEITHSTATTTAFNIAHGLLGTPRSAIVVPGSAAARAAPFHVTLTTANIVLNYASTLTTGTTILHYYWSAEM